MKRRIKIIVIVVSVLIVILIAGAGLYYFSPFPSDHGTFVKMRKYQEEQLLSYGSSEREINNRFANYKLDLPWLYRFMFKAQNLSLYLKSSETDRIEIATANQLEIGNDTGNYFDFTFMIRPRPEYKAPMFHGDALKALPGVTGALYMDFYSLTDSVDLEYFFRNSNGKLEKALQLAEPYWKHEGFGELTPHLDPYKSPWRLEIVVPEGDPDEEKVYYEIAYQCFTLYLEAFLEALEDYDQPLSDDVIAENRKALSDFVGVLYEEDIAVKMGKMIFPEEDFDTYFLQGFWGAEL